MKPVKLIIAGGGNRGSSYARYIAAHPKQARIVGVAEPKDYYRDRMAQDHRIPAGNVFRDWREMAEKPRFADAVIVATQDSMHKEPALAFMDRGYHILLEKPMAPNPADCRSIVEAAKRSGVIFAVCHVLRYTSYTQKVMELISSGAVGEVMSIQHLERVGFWHQAHSFVRGNWRNEKLSSPMLLAKSCHDLDWISHIMGDRRCRRISSFGGLSHFRKEHKPKEAGDALRCLDCAHEKRCVYSAKRFYLKRLAEGNTAWPVNVLTPDVTPKGVEKALREGPYGRCVYECDNDVVDHQVVSLELEDGRTAGFTMTAFTEVADRKSTILGTGGTLYAASPKIEHFDFFTEKWEVIDTSASDPTAAGGHGGGDYRLMKAFVEALARDDPKRILTGPDISLETHLMVFAAEKARRENRVVDMAEMRA